MNRNEFLKNSGLVALYSFSLGSVYYAYSDWQEKKRQREIAEINNRRYSQKYNGLSYKFLDLANILGSNQADRQIIDNIITRAISNLEPLSVSNSGSFSDRKEAIKALKTIDDAIHDEGLKTTNDAIRDGKLEKSNNYNIILHEVLKNKVLDCVSLSVIYYDISKIKNFNLAVVAAPRHVFLKCYLGNDNFNWESLDAKVFSNDYYRKNPDISRESEENGVFLKNLTEDEILSYQYTKIGRRLDELGFKESLDYFKKAVELYPKGRDINSNMGLFYYNKGNYKEAIYWYKKAIKLDTKFYDAYYKLGQSYKQLNNDKEAEFYFNKANSLK